MLMDMCILMGLLVYVWVCVVSGYMCTVSICVYWCVVCVYVCFCVYSIDFVYGYGCGCILVCMFFGVCMY